LKPPLEFLLEHLSPIQPRYYSCSRLQPDFTFAFNIVKREDGYNGLCSNWLVRIAESNITFDVIVRSVAVQFRVPKEGEPIFICNGTGISPMIAFIEELQESNRHSTLVYGHRTKEDAIYLNDIQHLVDSEKVELIECLSKSDSEYNYVQDCLHKVGDLFTRPIVLCGSVAMGKSVESKLYELYTEVNGVTKLEAIEYFQEKLKAGTFVKELWG
jgi:sulfite reductase alpha subunit-like flavoprotein